MKKIILPFLMLFCVCLSGNAQSSLKQLGDDINNLINIFKEADSYSVDLKSGKIKAMVHGLIPVAIKGFSVKVNRCVGMGNTVFIDMVFSNDTSKDFERFSISNDDGQATDDKGSTINARDIQMAIGDNSMSSSSSSLLPAEVSLKIHLKIENVSESATKLKRLGICLNADELGIDRKPLWFKNLPITRE